jgi:large subunit ribosomal protein L10
MLRAQKNDLVADIKNDISRSVGVLFLDFTGLTVAEADSLRRRLQQKNVRYLVTKNTLLKIALDGTPYTDAAKCLKGTPTGVVFGYDDPVQSAKAVFDFMEECQHLKVKGGVLDSKALTPSEAEALSKMPGKRELQATVVQLALSPGRKLAAQLKSPAGRVVGAIEALVKRLEG